MNIEKLKNDILQAEGFELKPYKDSLGFLSIGIGRNLDDRGITKEEALYLFENDLDGVVREASTLPLFDSLNETRQRVLAEMLFNLGLNRLLKFTKMWKAINMEDWDLAAIEMMDSEWASQVGKRAQRLSLAMAKGE